MPAGRNGIPGAGLVLVLAALAAGCADYHPGDRIAYAEGSTVHLAQVQGGELVEIASAALPREGLLAGHAIFGLVKHPGEPWLYASSFNDCGQSAGGCRGNARIDRFEVGGNRIDHAGAAFVYDRSVAVVAPCAREDASRYPGQTGTCAPVGGGFSADGSRLYVEESDHGALDILAVGEGGGLTLYWQGEEDEVSLRGIARHPAAPWLYNGARVIAVLDDRSAVETPGPGGNDTALLGTDALVTTIGTEVVAIYSLADPAVPALVDSVTLASEQARSVDVDPARGRLVAAGRDRVTTFTFDGESLTEADAIGYDEAERIEFQGVAMLDGGDRAVAAWSMASDASPSGRVGGVTVFEIAADGALAERDTLAAPAAARALVTLGE